jgi:hypothetical protein
LAYWHERHSVPPASLATHGPSRDPPCMFPVQTLYLSPVSEPIPCGRPAPSAGPRQVPVPLQSEGRTPRISAEEEEGFTPRG